ncbi:MAG: hypothetical protein Q9171_003352 [Xanthocarpia ochracea]
MGVRKGVEYACEVGDWRRGVFGAEERTQDWEASGEDSNVAFDVHPDADANGGVGGVGKSELGEIGEANYPCYADTGWVGLVCIEDYAGTENIPKVEKRKETGAHTSYPERKAQRPPFSWVSPCSFPKAKV